MLEEGQSIEFQCPTLYSILLKKNLKNLAIWSYMIWAQKNSFLPVLHNFGPPGAFNLAFKVLKRAKVVTLIVCSSISNFFQLIPAQLWWFWAILVKINRKSWKLGIFREKRGLTGKAWTCFVKMCVLSYPWLTYNPCPGLGQFFKSPQKLSQSSKICLFWPIYHFFPGLTPSRRATFIFFCQHPFGSNCPMV